MVDDMKEELKNSFFNFVYRLLCRGINPINQFADLKSALQHELIKILSKERQELSEPWNTYPADY